MPSGSEVVNDEDVAWHSPSRESGRRTEGIRYNTIVAVFHVTLSRSGPDWDSSRPMEEQSDWDAHASFMDGLVAEGFILLGGPLADEHRVVHVVEAESDDEVRATLARDPWSESHLRIESVDSWTIRLDGRRD